MSYQPAWFPPGSVGGALPGETFGLIDLPIATIIVVNAIGLRTDTSGSGRVAVFRKSAALDNFSGSVEMMGSELTDLARRGSQMASATMGLSIDGGKLRVDCTGPNGSTVEWKITWSPLIEVVL